MAANDWIDYYYILDLSDPINQTGKGPDSSPQEIKKANRKKAKLWHTDMAGMREGTPLWNHANEQMKLVNEAYSIFRDPTKKAAYDLQWFKRNPWFKQQRGDESAHTEQLDIAVRWDPPDALSNHFYNIPKGEKRRAKLHITSRRGKGFTVEIQVPSSGWLSVISPTNQQGVVPFTSEIEVDTSNLIYGRVYEGELEFILSAEMASTHRQRLRVRTKVQDGPPTPPPPTPQSATSKPLFGPSSSRNAVFLLLGVLVILFLVIIVGNAQNRTPSQQPVQQAAQVAPLNTPPPTATSTPTPVPEIVETDNPAVSISMYSDSSLGSDGRLIYKFLRYDDRVDDLKVEILALVKDIVGDWAVEKAGIAFGKPDVTGFYAFDLPPYTYLTTPNYASAFMGHDVYPNWFSDKNLMDSRHERWGVIFPVESAKVTVVEVLLSRLVIGVVDENGKAITRGRDRGPGYRDWSVRLCAEDHRNFTDLAYYCKGVAIDERGQSVFHMAPGDFFLELPLESIPPPKCFGSSPIPVSVGNHELKEITITIDTQQQYRCREYQPLQHPK